MKIYMKSSLIDGDLNDKSLIARIIDEYKINNFHFTAQVEVILVYLVHIILLKLT